MRMSDKTAAFLLVLLLGCVSAGLYGVLMLRFETGDVYPAYSSLRPDPLGAKALFEAFERIPGVSIERNYRPLTKLAGKENLTLFYLGLRPEFLASGPDKVVDGIEALAGKGARVVMAFRSGVRRPAARIVPPGTAGENENPRQNSQKDTDEQQAADAQREKEARKSAGEKWGVKASYLPALQPNERDIAVASLKEGAAGLPDDFPLHSAFCFKDLGRDWKVLYSAGECPIIIERPLGAGGLVLVADSFIFSNEAMLKERSPCLLSWLAGNCRSIVFDEHHLGVSEHPGMMTLLRRYRLHGFFAALALLSGLFLWRNMVRFIPEVMDEPAKNPGVSPGGDQVDGLVNLLGRNIKPGVLLATCFDEWEKTAGRDRRGMDDRIRQARDVVREETGKKRDNAAAYREISRILSDRIRR